eukprot:TRINITY_DN9505_c0_g2_i1.p1 TRINITY_DN9505_c0_g2~~TRINITY_DN9505_c0_g2_i1.p1  ORF type:complete len:274 (+),score=46.29 TRINITY_DN9505_c0_g2_i1:75-896(+)
MARGLATDCGGLRDREAIAGSSSASSASGGGSAQLVATVDEEHQHLFAHFCELRRVALRSKREEKQDKFEQEQANKPQSLPALLNQKATPPQQAVTSGTARRSVRTVARKIDTQQMTIAATYLDSGGAVRCGCMPALAKLAANARGAVEHLAILRALTRTAKEVRGRKAVARFLSEELRGLTAVRRWMGEAAAASGGRLKHEASEVLHHCLDLLRSARLPGPRAHSEGLPALCAAVADDHPQMRLFTAELLAGWGASPPCTQGECFAPLALEG